MSVLVPCPCGASYDLREEFAGRLVKCPQCGRESRAPGSPPSAAPQADPAFDRDVFLLRQKMLRISEKYDVCDERGSSIVFVERPAHFLRNFAALMAGVAVFFVVFIALPATFGSLVPEPATSGTGDVSEVMALLGFVLGLVAAALVAFPLSAKRHMTFYRDASKRERLLDVLQDAKFQWITVTYTVRDAEQRLLASLRKNRLTDLVRKRWWCAAADGSPLVMAREDSALLSLLRRILGPFFGLLRTDFVLLRPDGRTELGEFKRKLTILDRYVLDLGADRARTLDRRIALALGVMLDTGERR